MKRFGILILAATLGAGFSNSVHIQAAAAEQTSIKIPTNLALGGKATASGEYAPHQGKDKAFDQDIFSKWLTFNSPAWLQYEFPDAKVVTSYSITSAEDEPYRDPKSWVLKGSNDGTSWTQLDVQQNQSFTSRHQMKTYSFSNKTAYKFVKFDNFHNQNGSGMLQVSEIKLYDGSSKEWSTTKPEVAASGENKPNNTKENLVDGTSVTKWLTKDNTAWLTFDFGKSVTIDGYSLTAADDRPERDPKSWVLQGSNDNKNWTSIDKKSNEIFKVRHQRMYYLLDNNTAAYQYYRLSNMKNHSGNSMQLGEVEFSRSNDIGHAINPKIEVQILDSKGIGKIFKKALPNAEKEILAVARKVHEMLYKSPADAPVDVKKILVTIVDSPEGVAWTSGDATLKTVGFSAQYLQKFVESPAKSLRDEIIGILYHEIGHVYQYSNFDVEAIADSLRYRAGYHDRYSARKGGSWETHGTANFLRWIEDTKKRGFIRELNATQIPYNTGGENEKRLWKERQIKLITGTDVQTLWSQYQASLPN
ncbi:discoidin domain-containing protein [Paenibacillus sp. MER 180]|uniref:basic secretory protein-like protein n=1 Tax=Paenibacillus sp. MER 180 TaxID=2939570 RepID=UPI00203E96A7|nr:basic secretory protein-like protein [Paenibacillus sp. MER 180]MCM3292644.1 discoidin domain-containing protein [Paenibacillus sp. MER 180]